MESRISMITLGVSDLSASRKFYEALGFSTNWSEDKGVIFFKTTGAVLALYKFSDLLKDIGWGTGEKKFGGITIAHNTREKQQVDEIMQKVQASGGRVVKAPHEAFWGGYSGYFADPDGHIWEVAWGAFPIKEDGSLEITVPH